MQKTLSPAKINDFNFRKSAVRDLAWLMFSPSLFANALEDFSAFDPRIDENRCFQWFKELDRNTSPSDLPSRKDFRRLGLYCEALFEFFFQNARSQKLSPYDIAMRNIRLYDNKITLGELDFLLFNRESGDLVHVELAVKFFLQREASAVQWQDWVGPNASDRLDIKLKRMIEHQLPLPHRERVLDQIKDIKNNIETKSSLSSYHFIKGSLFSHPDSQRSKIVLPNNSTLSKPQGQWMRLRGLTTHNSELFYLCEKMEWLTPYHCNNLAIDRGLSAVDAHQYITNMHKQSRTRFNGKVPGVLLVKEKDSGDKTCVMLVPSYWPATSSPSRKM